MGKVGFGSRAAVCNPFTVGPLSGVKPTRSGRKQTPGVEGRFDAGKRRTLTRPPMRADTYKRRSL